MTLTRLSLAVLMLACCACGRTPWHPDPPSWRPPAPKPALHDRDDVGIAIGGANEGEGAVGEGEGTSAPTPPATAPLRRLTQEELNHTLRDLFTGVALPLVTLNDGQGAGYDGDVARQTPSDLVVDQMRAASLQIVDAVGEHLDAVLPRVPSSTDVADQRAAGHEFVASFAPRVLRRPLEQRELDTYAGLFDSTFDAQCAVGVDGAFDVAIAIVIQSLLQAPSFLYRVEIGDGGGGAGDGDRVALSPHEIASRLSYMLWGSMPDAALFDAAATGALASDDDVEAQARRMLGDPRAHDAVLSFARQWLDLDRVLASPKDAATFPTWSSSLAQSARREADAMIDEAVFGNEISGGADATLHTLLTTTTTRVDAQLAALYGVPAPANDWDLVELPGETRAGLLTSAAFLASRAHAVYGSPVLRGVFVLDRFLCEAPPPPGAAVNTNPPTPETTSTTAPTTNRSRYAQHTSDAYCQGCHASIDGIGMGFEGYDAVGRFRTTDNGFPVDDSGSLELTSVGGEFAGAPALAEMLAAAPSVQDCVTRHALTWVHGRAEEDNDWEQVSDVAAQFEGSGGDVKELLVAIAKSRELRTIPTVQQVQP